MFTGIIEDIGDIKSIKHEGDSAVLESSAHYHLLDRSM